ncbi:hypothetical protein, partial [Caldilinea sp.]|uniref:hypothetical protein n=1 Tax=Caldilinea sp. TaxID=2293560 RepID=UPI002B9323DF|nr:hypothetical protein [Caldilinea sp.]
QRSRKGAISALRNVAMGSPFGPSDRHRVAHCHQPLLDFAQLAPLRVLKEERVATGQPPDLSDESDQMSRT